MKADQNPPSVEADSVRLVRINIFEHLEQAEYIALKPEAWSEKDADNARVVIPDLVTVLRGVLLLHDGPGDCPTCQAPWPCPEFTTIHQLVKDPDAIFVKLIEAQYDN